jgi:spore germination protein KC
MSYIPALRLEEGLWKESKKTTPMLEYEGIHVFRNEKYHGHMNLNDLAGLPWVEDMTVRAPLPLLRENSLAACVGREESEH